MSTRGYIGSYTKKEGKGIYRFELNEDSGQIETVETGYDIQASTYLAQTEDFLYAITKEGDDCGVAAFKKDDEGQLTLINKCLESTQGTGCYISVSRNRKFLFEAVYGAGLARIYQLNKETGEVVKLIEELAHDYTTGSHERQDNAHVHYINETPDGKYVVATDLGTDRVVAYTFGDEGFKEHEITKFKDQDGPRHIAFHRNGKYAYVVHELSNYVSVMQYNDGQFEELERHLTIPEDFEGDTKLAAVRLSHDQQSLYVSNRGHDSIAVFTVAEDGAALNPVEIVKSGGEFPRDFNITESDEYLVCAHQEGDYKVTVFSRDTNSGKLTAKDNKHIAPEGVFVGFLDK
ncbi:6-phosphogluconolactonase [Staphylococcus caledonicus]|uniref:6-phosphogluconolactonase n=1 Tax=Staphylococcus caledonicus TaxID=2741333 RepID=UPI0018E4A5DC|nr:lactonase family protein [Staphylococcus caledonicus]MBI5973717.1 lactonase family protein [Staphylococcus caledonicus]